MASSAVVAGQLAVAFAASWAGSEVEVETNYATKLRIKNYFVGYQNHGVLATGMPLDKLFYKSNIVAIKIKKLIPARRGIFCLVVESGRKWWLFYQAE